MVELTAHSAGFRRSLPDGILRALSELVRSMNCYYSNLIEGHDTHPVDIEKALNKDFSSNPDKRNLQLEATAHIAELEEQMCEKRSRVGQGKREHLARTYRPCQAKGCGYSQGQGSLRHTIERLW